MMGSDQHHDHASAPGDEELRLALHRLADSAGGRPLLSGAELRDRAGRRRRRTRLVVVPTAAVAGLLAGVTAFALTGHHSTPGGPSAPARSALPLAPGASGEAAAPVPGASRASGPAGPTRPSGSPAATASATSSRPVLPGPTGGAACAVPEAGETLVLLHAQSAVGALRTGTGTLFSATPVACVHGRPTPSGPQRLLETAPDAVVTTTAPLGSGSVAKQSTLEELAAQLAGHPDQLFGIRRNAAGLVTRLDEAGLR